jgi:hypothetical protein
MGMSSHSPERADVASTYDKETSSMTGFYQTLDGLQFGALWIRV